jgi:hypothetical protein
MSFLSPKSPAQPSPTPTRADPSVLNAGQQDRVAGLASLVNTSAQGLTRKGKTAKRTLIGGSA